MSFLRLEDSFFSHPKARAVGKDGRELFLAGLCWCSTNLTDGKIPKTSLPLIAALAEVRVAVAPKLVASGFWIDEGDQYVVHNYLKFQRSRAQVDADKAKAAERQRHAREKKESQSKSRRDTKRSHSDSHAVSHTAHLHLDDENASRFLGDDEASQGESAGRRVARQHWEASDPKPTLSGKFVALMKLCEHFCEAGWPEDELLSALGRTRSYTIDAITFALNERRTAARGSERSIENIRTAVLRDDELPNGVRAIPRAVS